MRIKPDTGLRDIVFKMSDGNPGAITYMMGILSEYSEIDPGAVMGGIGVLLSFDAWGIYGSDIAVLVKDRCDRDLRKLSVLIRAVQLGFIPCERVARMARDRTAEGLSDSEWEDIDQMVCDCLPNFKRKENE